jgi:TIR domain
MSYVPRVLDVEIESDVFISYAHIDNEPLRQDQQGWISEFHHSLQVRLRQLLGSDLAIWRDPLIPGNAVLDATLVEKLRKSAVLVSILSPRYLRSDYCLKELREFFRTVQERGRREPVDQAPVFKVVKTHIPREEHPPELLPLLGYEFYRIDEVTGRPREFLVDPRLDGWRDYWAKLEDLAYDIHELLKTLREGQGRPRSATVYLAESTSDLEPQRDCIRRELQERGCEVLPSCPLPPLAADLEARVRDDLVRCQLSIHPIGRAYGIIPEGESRSMVHLQIDLAAACPAEPPLRRLVWIPPGLRDAEPRQQAYLHTLRSEVVAAAGVELLETTFEELKAIVADKLRTPTPPAVPLPAAPGPCRIYLICDNQDHDAIRPLEDWLFGQGYEVLLSSITGEEAQIREYHKETLVVCDAALFYYASASEVTIRTRLRDLEKSYGYGRPRTREFPAAVYVGPPETDAKQRFRTLEAQVLHCFGGFSPERLQPFLSRLRRP